MNHKFDEPGYNELVGEKGAEWYNIVQDKNCLKERNQNEVEWDDLSHDVD